MKTYNEIERQNRNVLSGKKKILIHRNSVTSFVTRTLDPKVIEKAKEFEARRKNLRDAEGPSKYLARVESDNNYQRIFKKKGRHAIVMTFKKMFVSPKQKEKMYHSFIDENGDIHCKEIKQVG